MNETESNKSGAHAYILLGCSQVDALVGDKLVTVKISFHVNFNRYLFTIDTPKYSPGKNHMLKKYSLGHQTRRQSYQYHKLFPSNICLQADTKHDKLFQETIS